MQTKIISLWGGPGCVSADTVLQFETETTRMRGCRRYTIRRAYEKFHGLAKKMKKGKNHVWREPVYTLSLHEDGGINYNQIRDIIASGEKEVYCVKTANGRELTASAEHPFKVADGTEGADAEGYVTLQELRVGTRVVCRRNATLSAQPKVKRCDRRAVHVPLHPRARSKRVRNSSGDYHYKLVSEHRLVAEAELNGITYENYVQALNGTTLPRTFTFLPSKVEVHHENRDVRDNRVGNLTILTKVEHAREHGEENRLHFGNQQAELDTVVSITPCGKQDTYDLVMHDPHRNYVAGGFVVHNSGKSTTAAWLFATLKQQGQNVELVREYVKAWAYEKRIPGKFDQLYLFGKQVRAESLLFGRVDTIITDSPVALGMYYARRYAPKPIATAVEAATRGYYDACRLEGHRHCHVFLTRTKTYNPVGRFQTETEAREVDVGMQELLKELYIPYHVSGTSTAELTDLLTRV